MSDKIEPALSAEEWTPRMEELLPGDSPTRIIAGAERGNTRVQIDEVWGDNAIVVSNADDKWESVSQHSTQAGLAAIITLANAALRDSDPRKLTRAKIQTLRYALDLIPRSDDEDHAEYLAANAHVDALESYLPPIQ